MIQRRGVASRLLEDSRMVSCSWQMFLAAHRVQVPRRRRRAARDRVLVFAPDSAVRRWVEHELFGEAVTAEIVEALANIVASLTLVPPPWPQLLIVDAAAISPSEIEMLGTIREAGWPGWVIAIGEPSRKMHDALAIDVVLARTLGSEILRRAIRDVGRERSTMPMRRQGR